MHQTSYDFLRSSLLYRRSTKYGEISSKKFKIQNFENFITAESDISSIFHLFSMAFRIKHFKKSIEFLNLTEHY